MRVVFDATPIHSDFHLISLDFTGFHSPYYTPVGTVSLALTFKVQKEIAVFLVDKRSVKYIM